MGEHLESTETNHSVMAEEEEYCYGFSTSVGERVTFHAETELVSKEDISDHFSDLQEDVFDCPVQFSNFKIDDFYANEISKLNITKSIIFYCCSMTTSAAKKLGETFQSLSIQCAGHTLHQYCEIMRTASTTLSIDGVSLGFTMEPVINKQVIRSLLQGHMKVLKLDIKDVLTGTAVRLLSRTIPYLGEIYTDIRVRVGTSFNALKHQTSTSLSSWIKAFDRGASFQFGPVLSLNISETVDIIYILTHRKFSVPGLMVKQSNELFGLGVFKKALLSAVAKQGMQACWQSDNHILGQYEFLRAEFKIGDHYIAF